MEWHEGQSYIRGGLEWHKEEHSYARGGVSRLTISEG